MENYSILLTINDPIRPITAGYDEGKKIATWTRNGKRLIDTEKFQEICKTFNVPLVECAYDGATALNCPKKRLSKATDRTKVFVEKCFSSQIDTENVKISFTIVFNVFLTNLFRLN